MVSPAITCELLPRAGWQVTLRKLGLQLGAFPAERRSQCPCSWGTVPAGLPQRPRDSAPAWLGHMGMALTNGSTLLVVQAPSTRGLGQHLGSVSEVGLAGPRHRRTHLLLGLPRCLGVTCWA